MGPDKHKLLQTQANLFLCRLLPVPCSTSAYTAHKELAVPYLEDALQTSPTTLWHNIRSKDGTKFTKKMITDCLTLEHGARIPWLAYVNSLLKEVEGKLNIEDSVGVLLFSKKDLNTILIGKRMANRVGRECFKPTVSMYLSGPIQPSAQRYLIKVSNTQPRFYLTRL